MQKKYNIDLRINLMVDDENGVLNPSVIITQEEDNIRNLLQETVDKYIGNSKLKGITRVALVSIIKNDQKI